jgi:hypothetical protein
VKIAERSDLEPGSRKLFDTIRIKVPALDSGYVCRRQEASPSRFAVVARAHEERSNVG